MDWRGLVETLDDVVDSVWAEPVRFVPWRSASEYALGEADDTRPIVDAKGVVTLSSNVIHPMGDRFIAKIDVADVTLSIRFDDLADALPRQGDRVVLLWRGLVFQINEPPAPDSSDRVVMNLIRLTDAELAEM